MYDLERIDDGYGQHFDEHAYHHQAPLMMDPAYYAYDTAAQHPLYAFMPSPHQNGMSAKTFPTLKPQKYDPHDLAAKI